MHLSKTFRDTLAARIREIRIDRFGMDEEDAAKLARSLGIPAKTWLNYERGVTLPAEIILKLIDLTGVDHRWLLTGKGERYSVKRPGPMFGFDN